MKDKTKRTLLVVPGVVVCVALTVVIASRFNRPAAVDPTRKARRPPKRSHSGDQDTDITPPTQETRHNRRPRATRTLRYRADHSGRSREARRAEAPSTGQRITTPLRMCRRRTAMRKRRPPTPKSTPRDRPVNSDSAAPSKWSGLGAGFGYVTPGDEIRDQSIRFV
jgi:hypothetical protein